MRRLCALVIALVVGLGTRASGIDFSMTDDLSVYGRGGSALNPDVEVKGFSVFGSTQAAYPGLAAGPGNVAVNGTLWISTGVYASSATFISSVTFADAGGRGGFINSSIAAALGGGLTISTNVYVIGFSSAARYYGSGSGLTNVPGDNLGNHTATQALDMAGFGVNTSSDITAARCQINGSTVLAITGGTSLALGLNAGPVNTGADNLFAGYNSGLVNTTGTGNVFVGAEAGRANVSGSDNTFFGYAAGYNNTADSNTFVGAAAGYGNTSGSNNTVVGSSAGYTNQTGSDNAIIGGLAGYGSGSFSGSTLLGYGAGYSLGAGGDNNIFLGWQAGYNIQTGSGNIIIGLGETGSGVQGAAASSMTLNIGGLILGNMHSASRSVSISTGAGAYYPLYASAFTVASSGRLKKDIEPSAYGLGAALKLKPRSFRYRFSQERAQIGFIAEEVAEVVPEAVDIGPDGYPGISYTKLVAVLAGAVRDRQKALDAQRAEIDELKAKLEARSKRKPEMAGE